MSSESPTSSLDELLGRGGLEFSAGQLRRMGSEMDRATPRMTSDAVLKLCAGLGVDACVLRARILSEELTDHHDR